MPFEHALWKIGGKLSRLAPAALDDEEALEDYISTDIGILNDRWMLIGRQVHTDYGKFIDLLALDETGTLIVIELKRNLTPRDVVAQAIDYAAWVENLTSDRIADIFLQYAATYRKDLQGLSLDAAFKQRFKCDLPQDDLNETHQIVVVAARLDESTERIVTYLSDRGIAINVVFFQVFADGGQRFLSRVWFLDPSETQERALNATRDKVPWNGEYYISFGVGPTRTWEDAVRYGFISAGGGRWYTNTLALLSKGDRVWVNIPREGYVGVGIVEEPVVKVDAFLVTLNDGTRVPITKAPVTGPEIAQHVDDEELAEQLVRVTWLKWVPQDQAIKETGFFGNQNSVCRPASPKWVHTVERLKQRFGVTGP